MYSLYSLCVLVTTVLSSVQLAAVVCGSLPAAEDAPSLTFEVKENQVMVLFFFLFSSRTSSSSNFSGKLNGIKASTKLFLDQYLPGTFLPHPADLCGSPHQLTPSRFLRQKPGEMSRDCRDSNLPSCPRWAMVCWSLGYP